MENRPVVVEVIRMVDPRTYIIRDHGSRQQRAFDELCDAMDSYFNSEAFTPKTPLTAALGKFYIGKYQNNWHRLRVDQVLHRLAGITASCYLLDHGYDNVMIPLHCLREATEEFFRLPFQVQLCTLHDIHPITLQMDISLNNRWGAASKWDESATNFMKNIIDRTKSWKVTRVCEHKDGCEVVLYACDDTNEVNVNELLIREKYAMNADHLREAASLEISPGSGKSPSWQVSLERTVEEQSRSSEGSFSDSSPSSPCRRPATARVNRVASSCQNAAESALHLSSGFEDEVQSSSGSFGSPQLIPKDVQSKRHIFVSSESDREAQQSTGGSASNRESRQTSDAVNLEKDSASGTTPSVTDVVSSRPSSSSTSSSAVKGRLPKHLKSSGSQSASVANVPSLQEFVIPNTNRPNHIPNAPTKSPSQGSIAESPLEKSSGINPPALAAAANGSVCYGKNEQSTLKSSPVPGFGPPDSRPEKEIDAKCSSDQFPPALNLSSLCEGTKMTAEELEILVDGSTLVRCVSDINGLPFIELMRSTPQLKNINRATKLQSFVWPSVLRGVDVIGIAQSRYRDGNPGGKTLSYLLPIITLLNFRSSYQGLPKYSVSPYVLILCPTWSCVLNVYDQCRHILYYQCNLRMKQINIRVNMLYGGGGDDDQEVKLMNGCEILVSTPSSLLRMMGKKVTNLRRLSHLVLEEADILTEQFKPELEEIMAQYRLELKEREGLLAPRQILLFSQRWNSSLKEFAISQELCPVVVVASKMESAYYGHVTHAPVICLDHQRLNQLLSMISSKRKKTIICTSDSNQAKLIYETMVASAIYSLLARDETSSSDLSKVSYEWGQSHREDSQPVLVATDSILKCLSIRDASWIIHFDVPSKLDVFADRLWCLRKNFERFENQEKTDDCVSFIFVTEKSEHLSSRIIRVLERSGVDVPVKLAEMAEKHMENKEKGKRSDLCPNLKSFGFCRYQNFCRHRHKVFSSLDKPGLSTRHINLPEKGTVKIWVKHVADASRFYAQLMEYREDEIDGNWTPLRKEANNLAMDMAFHFGRSSNRHSATTASESQLYAWEDIQHVFHRVEVVEVFQVDQYHSPEQAEVFQVDIGGTFEVQISDLYELPEQFARVPYQAVEVFVCRIQPTDKDSSWSDKANIYLTENIQGEILEGNIVLSLGNSLWLDPLVKRNYLQELKLWHEMFTVRSLLLDISWAVENPKHLEQLHKACEGTIQLPASLSASLTTRHAYMTDGRIVSTKTEEFPQSGENCYYDVYVAAAKSPDLVYVQLVSREKELNQLNEEINRMMNLKDDWKTVEMKCGQLVLAQDPSSRQWRRGRIDGLNLPNMEVFFVDTGVTEDLPADCVIPMPTRLKQLPFQAIECSLVGLEPVQSEYLEECVDEIMALTGDAAGCLVKMQAQVVRKTEAHYTGRYHFAINLNNIWSTSYHFNVASQLVVKKFARLSSEKLRELFPQSYDDDTDGNAAQRMSQLCRNILEAKEINKRNAEQLQRLTADVCSSGKSRHDLVSIVGRALEYTWDFETASRLLESLTMLSKDNVGHCAELEQNETWDVLCHMYAKHESNDLLDEILVVFETMLTCTGCARMFVECGGLWLLGFFLQNSQLDFVTQTLIRLISLVLSNLDETRMVTGELESLKASVRHLVSVDTAIVLSSLKVMKQLICRHSSFKDDVRKFGGIKAICEKLENSSDKEMISEGVKLLTTLAHSNRFNRDEMLRLNASDILDKLSTATDVDMDTRCLSLDLNKRLKPQKQNVNCSEAADGTSSKTSLHRPKPPSHRQKMTNQPIPKERLALILESCRPNVRWTQSNWSVLLTVEVKDAQKRSDIATLTEDSIVFRAISLTTEYSFRFSLYELVVPERCETLVRPGCVYVGLRKKSKGVWPRLLRDKQLRYPFLTVDYSRFNDVFDSGSDADGDGSDDDKQESPLDLVKRLFIDSESSFSPSWPEHVGESKYPTATPDFSTANGFDSDSTDSDSVCDIDEKFDPRFLEDKQEGFYAF